MENSELDSAEPNLDGDDDRTVNLHLLNLVLLNLATFLVRRYTHQSAFNPKLYIPLAEFLFTLEVVGSGFETTVLARYLPSMVMNFIIFLLFFWWGYHNSKIKGGVYAHPAYYLEKIVIGEDDNFLFIFTILMVEITTARLAWLLLPKLLWVIEDSDETEYVCQRKMTFATFPAGVLLAFFNFIDRLNVHFGQTVAFFRHLLWATALTALIILTYVSIVGYYYNPLLASSVQYGCNGKITSDIFFVYWLAPMIGIWPILIYLNLD